MTTTAAARENFYRRVAELGGAVLGEYVNNRTPVHVRCQAGHDCWPYPTHTVRGVGICRRCAGLDPVTAERDFRDRLAALGATPAYEVWCGVNKPHKTICAAGHTCQPHPNHTAKGFGICRRCAGLDPVTAEKDFRARLAALSATPTYEVWCGVNRPHEAICVAGHACAPRPTALQGGQKGICRTCAGQDTRVAEQEFLARLAALGATPAYEVWSGVLKPHEIICAVGHHVTTYPMGLRDGEGPCRRCAGKVWDALYVVRDPVTGWVKFGITSGDPRPRLAKHRTDGYTEVLRLETGLPEGLAALTEQKIKVALEMAGAAPVRGSEYFDGEYLALIFNEINNWVPSVTD